MQAGGFLIKNLIKTVIPPELTCSICKNLMKDPVNCNSCKIWLCLSCTQEACNYGEKKHSFSPINRFLKNKIEEYQIKCKYHEKGCLKVLKIALIEKHEEKCEFSLQKEKTNINCDFSTLSSTNCPTSIFKCPTCKKQMLMPEKATHDCIKWLLELRGNLESENEKLYSENQEILNETDKLLLLHKNFKQKSEEQKICYENDNIQIKNDIENLKKAIEKEKSTKEARIKMKMKEFYEFLDLKNQASLEKNNKEIDTLFRKINNCTLDYLNNAKKSLFDFNCFVQADAHDLSRIPIDMKEYDQNPLRNFTNVGPRKIEYIKK